MNNSMLTRSTSLQNVLDEFDILFRDLFNTSVKTYTPISNKIIGYPADIKHTKEGVELIFAICGVDKEAIDIDVENDILSVLYKKPEQTKTSEYTYYYEGIAKRSFNFSFKLDPKLDSNKIEATMDRGLLTIKIPYHVDRMPFKKVIEIN